VSKRTERVQRVEANRPRWKFERDAEKAAARAANPPAPPRIVADAPSDEPPAPGVREVMNVVEAATFLGLSRDTVRVYANDGTIPGRRVGDRLLFSRTALMRWLSNAG
jgi:excisionase family DNA binding protein